MKGNLKLRLESERIDRKIINDICKYFDLKLGRCK